MKFALAFFLLVSSSSSFAYNWRRCKAMITKPSKKRDRALTGKILEDIWYSTIQPTTDATSEWTIGGLMSTTSYVTSTGPCRAIGMAHEERVKYIAATQDQLKMELSIGQGEHTIALASVFGCNTSGRSEFGRILRSKYSQVFNSDSNQSPQKITSKMVDVVADSEVLSNNCNPTVI